MVRILDSVIKYVLARLEKENLLKEDVAIKAKVLSTQEAIGNPEEYDFPILKGKEKIMEAEFRGFKGQAFTDMFGGYKGSLESIFKMKSSNNFRRALQVAVVNALAQYWNLADKTQHCKDETPKICASKIKDYVHKNYPQIRNIVIVGYQPAIIDVLSKEYDLRVLDLDADNIGKEKFGVKIENGDGGIGEILSSAELVLATGSTLVNGTIDRIIFHAGNKVIFYGITIAGASAMTNLRRLCFA
ncbi:MAG TPA: hypothetical protein DD381_05375 [Lentisphaeria bacterium]|nr:MAG: hypothetical protein A2X47_01545 [Lentisphaerae bacterium GWF2_38_69]HBM15761.1 hypothetical protein [Lentisphaeria bacterium]